MPCLMHFPCAAIRIGRGICTVIYFDIYIYIYLHISLDYVMIFLVKTAIKVQAISFTGTRPVAALFSFTGPCGRAMPLKMRLFLPVQNALRGVFLQQSPAILTTFAVFAIFGTDISIFDT